MTPEGIVRLLDKRRQAGTKMVLDGPEELELALDRFPGTVLLVTHDRRFLAGFRATRTLELSRVS